MLIKYIFEGTHSIAIYYYNQDDISEKDLLSYAALYYRDDKEPLKPISYRYITESEITDITKEYELEKSDIYKSEADNTITGVWAKFNKKESNVTNGPDV